MSAAVRVVFPPAMSPDAWSTDHGEGLRPDRWPYGLDRLGDCGARLAFDASAPLGTAAMLAALVAPRRTTPGDEVRVTWDELTAVRALQSGAPGPLYTGVIWATDPPTGARDRLRKALVRRALPRMSGLWCLSRPQVDRLRALLGRGGPSVSFLRFGVDEHFYSAAEYPDRPLVLSVGGDRDRDTATLFAALGRVRAEQPAARIVVQTSSTLPPPDGVEVFRHLRHTELRELYREASVVVLATRPNLHVSGMTVSLEAMATGRPVVVTHTPGMDDYVDAEVGVPVTLGDHEALASGVIGLLGRPDDARAMGERGRARVEQRHTSAGMARDLAAIIGGRA